MHQRIRSVVRMAAPPGVLKEVDLMPATHHLRRPKGIPKEAVPVYRLAPSNCEDAYAFVADALRRLGWEPVEEDYRIGHAQASGWVMVECWGIPPSRREAE